MEYYVLDQIESLMIPEHMFLSDKDADVCKISDLSLVRNFDYMSKEKVISDRFKKLLEYYLPDHGWRPFVFLDPKRSSQALFWYLQPEDYSPKGLEYYVDGTVSAIQVADWHVPKLFSVLSKWERTVTVIHISIAEDMQKRGILGLRLVPIDMKQ